jgi:filamentous hemagglutinin
VFTIGEAELKTLLQSRQVVGGAVESIAVGNGFAFQRTVDVGRTIGTSSLNHGGGATSILRVITDSAGNLITAFPF